VLLALSVVLLKKQERRPMRVANILHPWHQKIPQPGVESVDAGADRPWS
jgi:hypothetical protein